MPAATDASEPKGPSFGTFGGVFTPCTLTILGVIMFLRFGQVVGQAGLWAALAVVLASKAITTLTSLSLSAIATNTRVRGGGAYYLISRSLGVEFGGAIGVLFFLAQAISVAMYVIGFTEAVVATYPTLAPHSVTIASFVNMAVFVCVYIGAGWTIKVQYGILAVLGLSMLSFYLGAATDFSTTLLADNLSPHYREGQGFFTVFALFFPAVTGIMAGANMSGDLRDPARSIPRGTLAAVVVTSLIYLTLAVLLAGVRPHEELIDNNMVIRDVAVWPLLITAGVFAATLSSALGSMMGAPRILQAFARDEVFPWLKFFAAVSGPSREPRRATVFSFVIAEACVLLGDLNAIAPIITMFFMITYGLLNLATFYESITRNPSYRPTFRYCHWSLSLLGAVGCLAVMLLINWLWALVAIAVIGAIYAYIRFMEIEGRWGDLRGGVAFERARQALLRLEEEAYHPKNWRPVVLALASSAWSRPLLAIYGQWLTAGHGVLTLAQVVRGDVEDHAERRQRYENALKTFIAKEELRAFAAVVVENHLSDGVESLVQCHGIGGFKPNTVLFGWPKSESASLAFGASLRLLSRLRRSVICARLTADNAPPEPGMSEQQTHDALWDAPVGTIDVWWRGMQNGELMMLLAHLLQRNPEWRRNQIRVLRVVPNAEAISDVLDHINELAAASRIRVEPVVVVSNDAMRTIRETSAAAAIALLGFEAPVEGDEAAFYLRMEHLAGGLPRVLFIASAGGMALDS
ncbi:amino acid permease [Botrimarina hoheduenensis]|uniref:Putative fructoselysine transporter n=1 Tax=Botrimarina hoheduenensis TaxID=2528000 RepID=A0A5C5VU23_9BACT|nr:amino acid permease [Botrimarina hoheduenensis]TWT41415.1 putative fructoselysine transporter [Botrimarina hoheduenensis]